MVKTENNRSIKLNFAKHMDLIQNAKDLLFIIIAFGVFCLTVFTAWFIYYLAMIMRQVFLGIKETRDKINQVGETVREFKKKMEHGAAYLNLLSEGVEKVTQIIKNKKGKKEKKNK